MKTDAETILDILEKAQAHIEELQATLLQQQAMINAVLLCLRDRTEADPRELERLFLYYQRVVHQQLLQVNQEKILPLGAQRSAAGDSLAAPQ